jgi:hypothetical protein
MAIVIVSPGESSFAKMPGCRHRWLAAVIIAGSVQRKQALSD